MNWNTDGLDENAIESFKVAKRQYEDGSKLLNEIKVINESLLELELVKHLKLASDNNFRLAVPIDPSELKAQAIVTLGRRRQELQQKFNEYFGASKE